MSCRPTIARLACAALALFATSTAAAQTCETTRVSVGAGGGEANDRSEGATISSDGRFVAFWSAASNLVPGDTNGHRDVFVHDRTSGETTRVSVDSVGVQGNYDSYGHAISADGRFVAFDSTATNLVPGDTNGCSDVFVHERSSGETTRVSVDSGNGQGNAESGNPVISSDGRFVAFWSAASNLVPMDTNGRQDIFVHDRRSGATTRVSVDSGAGQGNDFSFHPTISSDGRYVAFHSDATNLVPGDTNGWWDVFIHDRTNGETTRVSVDSGGAQANEVSVYPAISSDGRYVAFSSSASNLVPGDTNNTRDIFVHDRTSGETARVSVDSSAVEGDSSSETSAISSDGRFLAFYSYAGNLVPGDTNGQPDVFVHDRTSGETTRVSVDSGGGQGDATSDHPVISSNGRFVAFGSVASNLVPGDTNGAWDIFVHDRHCQLGTPYCFGDGSGTPCPCANPGASGEGCANSGGAGALLAGFGSTSVSVDDLVFEATQLLPDQPALLFVGLNALSGGSGVVFGDGLRCVGGQVVRLGVMTPDANGDTSFGPGLGASGQWDPGDMRRFQVLYRDPAGPCGSGSNLTNGVELTLEP